MPGFTKEFSAKRDRFIDQVLVAMSSEHLSPKAPLVFETIQEATRVINLMEVVKKTNFYPISQTCIQRAIRRLNFSGNTNIVIQHTSSETYCDECHEECYHQGHVPPEEARKVDVPKWTNRIAWAFVVVCSLAIVYGLYSVWGIVLGK